MRPCVYTCVTGQYFLVYLIQTGNRKRFISQGFWYNFG